MSANAEHGEQAKPETSHAWDAVAELMAGQARVRLGPYSSYWMRHSPRRTLHYLAYYKFAAKLIGKPKRVLDAGCAEGLGTWLLAQECGGEVLGVDLDEELLDIARNNWPDARIRFAGGDFLQQRWDPAWDALVSFDVIEHILPEHVPLWWRQVTSCLRHDGLAIIGTPSEISQRFASEISRRGHVNIYTPERFEAELRTHFHHVFLFSAHDEVVHTGFAPLAHYHIALACRPRRS